MKNLRLYALANEYGWRRASRRGGGFEGGREGVKKAARGKPGGRRAGETRPVGSRG